MVSLFLTRQIPLYLSSYFNIHISDHHMVFYHIIWCPSTPFCVYNCRLFSFYYHVASFVFCQKQNVREFRLDYESSSFRKLGRNKWICRQTFDFFTSLVINSMFNFLFISNLSSFMLLCWCLHHYFHKGGVILLVFSDNINGLELIRLHSHHVFFEVKLLITTSRDFSVHEIVLSSEKKCVIQYFQSTVRNH